MDDFSTPHASPPSPPSRLRALLRANPLRLLGGGAVLAVILAALAYGLFTQLAPQQRFGPLTLPYVQEFTDVDPRRWFLEDGVWSIRNEMLAQAANLDRPAAIYLPAQITADQPYHFSTYITLANATQHAGINFNAQYPDMPQRQHRVYLARRTAADPNAPPPDPAMELVAGYADGDGAFVPQVTVPFGPDTGEYRLDLYVLGNTYTVQVNGQTLIDRRPTFYPNGLVGYYTLGPARFDTLRITTAATTAPGDQVYTSDFSQEFGGAGWVPFRGEWAITDGELVQADPAQQDAGIGYEGSAFEDYVVQATFRHLTGSGGGLLFNMISPYQLNGAQVVRFSEQTDAIFWGYFDAQGGFTRQGFQDVPAPGQDPQQLRVFVGATSYDVYWGDQLLARAVPLQSSGAGVDPGRSGGHIGLITARSSVAFSSVDAFPLFGGAPLATIQAAAPGITPTATLAAATQPTPTAAATRAPGATTPPRTPTAVAQATSLPATSALIRAGSGAAWAANFRGDLRQAGWRPLSGEWRFANDTLVQDDATGFDVAAVYAPNAFRNYRYTVSFSHQEGNGAGILFNLPYTDRLNGGHMVRYSDRRAGGIFWGYFDPIGKFIGQGYANVAPPSVVRHTLEVRSGDTTYSIYLDGFLLAEDLPLLQNYGHVGLVTVQSRATFDSALVGGPDDAPTGGQAVATQTPVAAPPLAAAGIYSGLIGFPELRTVSGRWDVADGVYKQIAPDPADYILNIGLYAAAYTLEADILLPDQPEAGGGFMVQMPDRGRKAGSTVVRFIQGGQAIFWGVYDETNAFRGRGSVELPLRPEGESGYRLRAEVRGSRMDVYVDDALVIENALLPRREGWIGLVAFGGPVTFDNVQVTVLPAQAAP